MPSINRSTYLTPVQRGAQPGGYDVMSTGAGTRSMIHFDPGGKGLQRRIGVWQDDPNLLRQGCQRTGRNVGAPGFEQPEYDCPFPIAGSPAWFQGRKQKRTTVFEGLRGLGFAPFPAWTVGALLIGFTSAALWWFYQDEAAARRNPMGKDMAEGWHRYNEALEYFDKGDMDHVRLRLAEAKVHANRIPEEAPRWGLLDAIDTLEFEVS